MPLDHSLACVECAEFIELHKWSTECMKDYPFRGEDEYRKYSVCHTDSNRISLGILEAKDSILKEIPEHWIGRLIPDVQNFLLEHGDHKLYIFDDRGDMPWYSDNPNWHRWKEVRGYMTTWGDKYEDVELPRNIIDDAGITTWELALQHYKNNCAFTDDPEKLSAIYELYLNN